MNCIVKNGNQNQQFHKLSNVLNTKFKENKIKIVEIRLVFYFRDQLYSGRRFRNEFWEFGRWIWNESGRLGRIVVYGITYVFILNFWCLTKLSNYNSF